MALLTSHNLQAPHILILAGLDGGDIGHWPGIFALHIDTVVRVPMGDVVQPQRNSWVSRLDAAIHQSSRPVILVAQGLACHAVAWWVALERPKFGGKVVGAVLIAPPNVDAGLSDTRVAAFGPTPKGMMPFQLIVAAKQADPGIDFFHAQTLAKFWGGACIDTGDANTSALLDTPGVWSYGLSLLREIIGPCQRELEGRRLPVTRGVAGTVPASIVQKPAARSIQPGF